MNLVGLMLVRNSDWVIGLTLRAALMYCDSVVVLMHRCEDRTAEIVRQVEWETRRVAIFEDQAQEWEEMRLRQTMLDIARELLKATHILTIDDDEVLAGSIGGVSMRCAIENLPDERCLFFPWLQLRGIGSVMTSGMWGRQSVSVAFKDDARFHWATRDGYDHHHRHPMGIPFQPYDPLNNSRNHGVMHLQFASKRRLLAKQFLYQLIERKRWPGRAMGADYALTVQEAQTAQIGRVDSAWWEPYRYILRYLDIDAEPWQERECKRLIVEERVPIAGLNDFGLLREWGLEGK